MECTRSESIPHPNIWRKFKGLREINGKIPEFWIQEITEDLVDQVNEYMQKGFIKEEPLCKYSKLAEDKVSVEEGRLYYKHYILRNKLSIVCMTNDAEGKRQIAGMSCLARISKDDPPLQPTGECYARVRSLVEYAYGVKDPYTHMGVNEYLAGRGIYIVPEFRGQGICVEILKTWPLICKAAGLKAALASFTSIGSQKAADRVGFQELNSFPYVELGKVNPKFILPGIEEHTKNLRLLYTLV